MEYSKTVRLKDGRECILRSGRASDAEAVLENFKQTHAETDYLLSYPEECVLTVEQEAEYLRARAEHPRETEIVAFVEGKVAGTAGIEQLGGSFKLRHRADLGISVLRELWGLGIGKALMEACLECAQSAGYSQVELTVVSENRRAITLYERFGFVEFGRNPRGFRSKLTGYQELVHMRRELSD